MYRYNTKVNVYRYFMILGTIIGSLLIIPSSKYAYYFSAVIILFLNFQIRLHFSNDKFKIASLIIDMPLILLIYTYFQGLNYLFFIITIIDTFFLLNKYILSIVTMAFLAFIYCISIINPIINIFLLILFYIFFILLLSHIKNQLNENEKISLLNDKIDKSNFELETAKLRMIEYSKEIEKISRAEERNRISRELHDSIGHNLTGILMQVDAAIHVLDNDKNKGMEILDSVYKNINKSIEDVRKTVRQIKPSEYKPSKNSISKLIDRFMKDTNINIELKTNGIPYQLTPGIEAVLYLSTMESITNSVRHGRSKNIWIHISYLSNFLDVVIKDDGIGCKVIEKGFGLSGMEERTEIVGGSIEFNGDKGFTTHIKLPQRRI